MEKPLFFIDPNKKMYEYKNKLYLDIDCNKRESPIRQCLISIILFEICPVYMILNSRKRNSYSRKRNELNRDFHCVREKKRWFH